MHKSFEPAKPRLEIPDGLNNIYFLFINACIQVRVENNINKSAEELERKTNNRLREANY